MDLFKDPLGFTLKSRWESVVYERTRLYHEVWSDPVCDVAKRYRVSDVALAKICRKLDVPLPGRGYWARKAAGQSVARTPMKARPEGKPTEIRSSRLRSLDELHPLDEAQLAQVANERDPSAAISVPESLDKARPIILAATKVLRKAKEDPHGFVSCRESPHLDVTVSIPSIDRAMRILDGLLTAFEQRGFKFEAKLPPPDPTAGFYARMNRAPEMKIQIGDEWIQFGISEKTERVPKPTPATPPKARSPMQVLISPTPPRPPPTYDLKASGQLALSLIGVESFAERRTWSDTGAHSLETLLNAFLAAAVQAAARMRNDRLDREREKRLRQEAELRAAEETRQRKEEEARVADLYQRVRNWSTATAVREFVRTLEASGEREDPNLRAWISWARSHADSIERAARHGLGGSVRPRTEGT